MNCHQLGPT